MLQAMREGLGKSIAIVILGLLAVTFVFFGIDFTMIGTQFAAKVNGEEIDVLEFERAYQNRQTSMMQEFGLTDLPEEFRRSLRADVLEGMVQQRALTQYVRDAGYRISDARLGQEIRSASSLTVNGRFSPELYAQVLRQEGITAEAFEAEQRQMLAIGELEDGIVESTFFTPTEFRRYIELYNQSRRAGIAQFNTTSFIDQVQVSEEQIREHYEQNGALYMTPETVDLEYVEIRLDDIIATIDITEDDLIEAYEDRRSLFTVEEERAASQILFEVGEDGSEEAQSEAQAALERLESGEDFEALARELSDDAGSAGQGGSLGRVSRNGFLAGPFTDALYGIEEIGAVAGPVETEFGVHLIRLDELLEGDVQTFDEVREELAEQLRTEQADEIFYDRAERLDELAFDANDELASVAEELDLPLQTATNFSRSGDAELFDYPSVVAAEAFSEDVLDERRNSGLITVGPQNNPAPDHVVVLRVTAHNEPEQMSFDDVREEILAELQMRAAEDLAREAAAAFLEGAANADNLNVLAEEHGGIWGAPDWLERSTSSVPSDLLSRVFSMDPPSGGAVANWEQVRLSSGNQAVVALYEIAPGEPDSLSVDEREEILRQLGQQTAIVELEAYAAAVRAEAKVRIPAEILEPQY